MAHMIVSPGIFDFRLSKLRKLSIYDYLFLGGQISFHAFSALNLPSQSEKHLSPKIFSGIMCALVGAATVSKVLASNESPEST